MLNVYLPKKKVVEKVNLLTGEKANPGVVAETQDSVREARFSSLLFAFFPPSLSHYPWDVLDCFLLAIKFDVEFGG